MATITEFQKTLLTDANARKEFASDPKAYLDKNGIVLPLNTQLPATIPQKELDDAVLVVQQHLGSNDISKLHSTAEVSKFVQTAFPPKASAHQLGKVQGAISAGARASEATIAVIAVVVAIPVVVFGATRHRGGDDV